MAITDILKTIFTFLSIILTGGYLLADLHTRNAMMKYSGDLQYDIAFHYSQLRTTCIIGFMGAIGFTVICMDHFFDSISTWILGNVTRIPRHELPQTLDFSDFLPLFT